MIFETTVSRSMPSGMIWTVEVMTRLPSGVSSAQFERALAALRELDGGGAPSVGKSLLLGVSTGLLWAPCAGPILGLILTGAAVEGADTDDDGLTDEQLEQQAGDLMAAELGL